MYRTVRAATTALAAAGACALPGLATAASPTPNDVQAAIKQIVGQIGGSGLALMPTQLPAHYLYESYSVAGGPPTVDISFADARFLKSSKVARLHEISFDTSYLPAKKSCSTGGKALRVDATTVYTQGRTVWRCVATTGKRTVKATATGDLSAPKLAILVVSARPIS